MTTYTSAGHVGKISNTANPRGMTKLELSGRDKTLKIQNIEDLHPFTNLISLDLSDNVICKIQNLESLRKLKILNLSHNEIRSLDGLQSLRCLSSLNLGSNLISIIPMWFSKNLVSLKSLNLSDNLITTVENVLRLQGFSKLTVLSFGGNPVTDKLSSITTVRNFDLRGRDDVAPNEQLCYRLFTVFHLHNLLFLDGLKVTLEERQVAKNTFSTASMRKVLRELEQQGGQRSRLNRFPLVTSRKSDLGTHHIQDERLVKLEEELRIKDSLLLSKSDELARACLKHYELEQELAFHKIDSKMAALLLGPRPEPDRRSIERIYSTGEHPYLGRCRSRILSSSLFSGHQSDGCLNGSYHSGEYLDLCPQLSYTNNDQKALNLSLHFPVESQDFMGQAIHEVDADRPSSAPTQSHHSPLLGSDDAWANQSSLLAQPPNLLSVNHPQYKTANENSVPVDPGDAKQLSCAVFKESRLNSNDPHSKQLPHLTTGFHGESCLTAQLAISVAKSTPVLCNPLAPPLSDGDLHAHITRLQSELALACSLSQLRGNRPATVHEPGDGASQYSGADCSGAKLGQLHTNGANIGRFPLPSQLSIENQSESVTSFSQTLPSRTASGGVKECPSHKFTSHPSASSSAYQLPEKRKSLPELISLSRASPSMPYSAASSTPSSRTAGTGRSALPSEIQQTSKGPTNTASRPRDLWGTSGTHGTTISEFSRLKREEIPTPPNSGDLCDNKSNRYVAWRRPGVGDVCRSMDLTLGATNVPSTQHPPCHRLSVPIDGFTPPTHCGDFHSRMHKENLLDPRCRAGLHKEDHQCLRATSLSNQRSDNTSDVEQSPVVNKKVVVNRQGVLECESASGFSRNGIGVGRRKRKVLRSMSNVVATRQNRLRSGGAKGRRESTDTISDHAEQLLDLLVMSREACASEMRKMRVDLARIQKSLPRSAADKCFTSSSGSPVLGFSSLPNRMEGTNVPCPCGRNSEVPSGRGTMRSYGDTLTSVTRPSLNGDEADYSFSPCEPSSANLPRLSRASGQRKRNQQQHRARRLLPNTQAPDYEENSSLENITDLVGPPAAGQLHRFKTDNFNDVASFDCPVPQQGESIHLHTLASNVNNQNGHHSRRNDMFPHSEGPPHSRSQHIFPSAHRSNECVRTRSLDARLWGAHSENHGHSSHDTGRADLMDDDEPSSETAALLNLTEELVGLRLGLKRTRQANSGRLEMALRHISSLEMELQRQRCAAHKSKNAQDRLAERARWEKRLAATLSELKQCQLSIGVLRSQMDELGVVKAESTQSQTQLERQQTELQQTRAALDAQKDEISRLNKLLNKLLGVNPADASPEDLEQLQAGVIELTRRVQADNVHAIHPDSVRRTQSLLTGLVPTNSSVDKTVSAQPLHCSVPEHHYLEDCMEQLQIKVAEMDAENRELQKKISRGMKNKKKLQSQIETQKTEMDRLTLAASAKQEELESVRKGLQDSLESERKQNQDRLHTLAADLCSIEVGIRKRREELAQMEEKIKEADTQLAARQTEIKDATSQRDSILSKHTKVKSELDGFTGELAVTSRQLDLTKEQLKRTQFEVDAVSQTKEQLQRSITELDQTIRSKQTELQRLSSKVLDMESKLTRLETEVTDGEHRIEGQRRVIAENENTLNERRSDVARLTQKIEEDQVKLEKLTRRSNDQQIEFEQLRLEKQREWDMVAAASRDSAAQTAAAQRELLEIRTSIKALLEEKQLISGSLETLNRERDQLLSDILSKKKACVDLEASLSRQNRELEHATNKIELEQHHIAELTSQQRDLIEQLNKLRSQIRQESDDLRGHDVVKLQKTSELENVCEETDREKMELERIVLQRQAAETDLEQLQQERGLVREETDRMRRKLNELKKQEKELTEVISSGRLELARLRLDSDAERVSLDQVKEHRRASQTEVEHLSKRIEEGRTEMVLAQKRLSSVNSAVDLQESNLVEQQHNRSRLGKELSQLDETMLRVRSAQKSADDKLSATETTLQATVEQLDRVSREVIELEQRAVSERSKVQSIDTDLAHKRSQLADLTEQINASETRLAQLGRTESRCLELERKVATTGVEPDGHPRGQVEPRNGLIDKSADSHTDVVRLKLALSQSQRDYKRLKRHNAREVAELERIAEEQCSRAGELSEQLILAKKQYAQLKEQISTYGILMDEVITVACQTELNEHGKRLEAALTAARAELEQTAVYGSSKHVAGSKRNTTVSPTNDPSPVTQQTSNPKSKSALSSDSMGGTFFLGPDRASEPFGEIVESTCHTGATTTSGLGSSMNPTNLHETMGIIPESSGGSSPNHLPHRESALTSEWKRQFSKRVAEQREQAACELDQSSAELRKLHAQVREVRAQLDRHSPRHTTKSGKRTSQQS